MIIFSWFLILSSVFFGSGDSSETGEISSPDNMIIGGFKINIEQVPWQVAYEWNFQSFCGGSIISNKWVLTAAHCSTGKPGYLTVRVGSTDKNSDGVVHEVKRRIQHPQYVYNTKDYDFALLELTDDIQFNDKARAIPLPSADQTFADDRMCLVTGWGETHSPSESDAHLRGVLLPIYNQEACKRNLIYRVTDRMICAGYEKGGKDTCLGDSGGPLIVYNNTNSIVNDDQYDNPILIGVVSWGQGCAEPYSPGVYARVTSVRKWIADVAGV